MKTEDYIAKVSKRASNFVMITLFIFIISV